MRTLVYYAFIGIFASIAVPAFAASPWNGTWKLDQSKSQMTGDTFTYSVEPNGTYHFTNGSTLQFTFACDGKDYTVVSDYTTACKKVSDTTSAMTTRQNGKLISTSTQVISADGKTMTVTTNGTRPDGTAYTDVAVDRRISGDSGLAGEWKTAKSSSSVSGVMKISTSGDTMTLEYPGYKQTVTAKLDGTDTPFTGPRLPPGVTLSLKTQGPNEVMEVLKLNGKEWSKDLLTVSPDGQTLTDLSWTPGKDNEKQTYVYEKQ